MLNITEAMIIETIDRFIHDIDFASGHYHLYGDFNRICVWVAGFRNNNGLMSYALANAILKAVECLTQENMFGGRPGSGMWETYYGVCMKNAYTLLKEYAIFDHYKVYCPLGLCNTFLETFIYMDKLHTNLYNHATESELCAHFEKMASWAAEMFFLTADSSTYVYEKLLDHPDDQIFTWLLSGFSKSILPEVDNILTAYAADDERWVQQLAKRLINERAKGNR